MIRLLAQYQYQTWMWSSLPATGLQSALCRVYGQNEMSCSETVCHTLPVSVAHLPPLSNAIAQLPA